MNRAKADISRSRDALGENEYRQCTYNEILNPGVVAVETLKYYTTLVRVFVTLGIRHAMRMRLTVTCGMHRSTWFFSTLSHKGTIFGKKVTEHKMCFDFSTNFTWNVSYSRKKWVGYDKKMSIGLHVKYPLLSSDFNETWIFSTDFGKIVQYPIS